MMQQGGGLKRAQSIDQEDCDPEAQRRRLEIIADGSNKVMEVFSPPRVAKMAGEMGLTQGSSIDLTTLDEDDGKPWDMNVPAKRWKVWEIVLRDRPALIVGSPKCTAFSCLQNLNKGKGDENKKKELMKEAVAHLEFCCALYHHQVSQG